MIAGILRLSTALCRFMLIEPAAGQEHRRARRPQLDKACPLRERADWAKRIEAGYVLQEERARFGIHRVTAFAEAEDFDMRWPPSGPCQSQS